MRGRERQRRLQPLLAGVRRGGRAPSPGRAADRFGGRNVFRLAIGLFTLGSIFCGMSDSVLELTAARVLQGFGGSMMVPVGRLVLFRSVEKSQLVRTLAYLQVPAQIGPVLGP